MLILIRALLILSQPQWTLTVIVVTIIPMILFRKRILLLLLVLIILILSGTEQSLCMSLLTITLLS